MTVDRTTAVMSIRPIYADRILAGTKTIEFRRQALGFAVERVLIWKTGKGGGFVGLFAIPLFGHSLTGVDSWAGNRGIGIDVADLAAYAGGPREMVWGYSIAGLVRFPRVIPGPELGTPFAPQSWRYAHEDWRHLLDVALAADGQVTR